jgi:hypothetical protein
MDRVIAMSVDKVPEASAPILNPDFEITLS